MKEYLTRRGVGKLLDVSVSRVRQLERENVIFPIGRAGEIWLFSIEHIEALRARRAERAQQPKVAH